MSRQGLADACTVELRIRKLRKGSYFPRFLEPRQLAEKAVTRQEALIQGISTRPVEGLVNAIGITEISKSQVSRLCEITDHRIQVSLGRRR